MTDTNADLNWALVIKRHELSSTERRAVAAMLSTQWDAFKGRTGQFNSEGMAFLKLYEAFDGSIVPEMPAMRLYYPNYGSALLRACYLFEDLHGDVLERICIDFDACRKIESMKSSDIPTIITGIADRNYRVGA